MAVTKAGKGGSGAGAPNAAAPAGRAGSARPGPSFGTSRRAHRRLATVVCTLLALYILVLANGIAYRHPWRIDLTEEKIHSLSEETRAHLASMREEIRVIVPLYRRVESEIHKVQVNVLARALELLDTYSMTQPLVRVLPPVDVLRDASRWKVLCEDHDLEPTLYNRLIFLTGAGDEFRQTLMPEDLAEVRPHPSNPHAPPEVRAFHGEEAVTGVISRLIHRTRMNVYFTRGHGELPLGDPTPIRPLRHDLEASGFDVRPLELDRVGRVPEDCRLLVIAGAEKDFTLEELDAIEDYLERHGRLLVTLGAARTRLEGVLERWGVEVLPGRVRARATAFENRIDTSWVFARSAHRVHPVMQPLAVRADLGIRFLEPRPLAIGATTRRMESERLLSTGGSTEGERYYLTGGLAADASPGAASGDYVLAVAARQEKLERPPENWVELKTRLIVVGASSFLTDNPRGGLHSGTHRAFLMNCVNWLVDREELVIGEGIQQVERKVQVADPSLRSFLFYASVCILPGIFLSLGIVAHFVRRA